MNEIFQIGEKCKSETVCRYSRECLRAKRIREKIETGNIEGIKSMIDCSPCEHPDALEAKRIADEFIAKNS